jgi:hypothetical protein
VDLWLGYGLGYLVSIPLVTCLTASGSMGAGPVWMGAFLALVFSTPHYGATLLRVYDRRQDRQRYAVFAVWITAALAALFGIGLFDDWTASLLVTAYVTWSPWHFAGQNYGLAVMNLRRRGVPFDPVTKRDLYISFVLSAVLAILAVHLAGSQKVFAIGASDPSGTIGVLWLGIPLAVVQPVTAVVTLAYVVFLVRAARGLMSKADGAALLPVALLVGTQALWFSVPALATALATTPLPPALAVPLSVAWISSAHAIQYLWVTCYYARRTDETNRAAPFLTRSLVVGACLFSPVFMLYPGFAGEYFPNAAGAAVLVASVVNLHHFALDGAIWKLRDGAVASALLRSAAPDPGEPLNRGRRWGFMRPAVLLVGGAAVVFQLYTFRLASIVAAPDTSLHELHSAARALERMGNAPPDLWARVGELAEQEKPDIAIAAFRRSIRANRQPPPWVADRLAWLLLRHRGDDPRSMKQARRLAVYVSRTLGPERPEGYLTLAASHAAFADWTEAAAVAESGIPVAQESGNDEIARNLRARATLYQRRAAEAGGPP